MARKKYKVQLLEGRFTLNHKDDPTTLEGPWDSRWAEEQPDGSVALLSEGMPVVLRVVKQDGQEITLDDGTVMVMAPEVTNLEATTRLSD